MVQNAEEPRRSRGRPQVRPDCDTLRVVIDAARQEFLTNGYEPASMAAVAQRAGVSTRTLYRLVPTKAELFRDVITERIGQFLLAIDADALDAFPLEEALERMLTAYGMLTLDAGTVILQRLVLAELHRFPKLADDFYKVAVLGTSAAMAAWLKRQCTRGLIALDDPLQAVGMLRGMMIMEPQRSAMLGQTTSPDEAMIAARAKFCARLFLEGCRNREAG